MLDLQLDVRSLSREARGRTLRTPALGALHDKTSASLSRMQRELAKNTTIGVVGVQGHPKSMVLQQEMENLDLVTKDKDPFLMVEDDHDVDDAQSATTDVESCAESASSASSGDNNFAVSGANYRSTTSSPRPFPFIVGRTGQHHREGPLGPFSLPRTAIESPDEPLLVENDRLNLGDLFSPRIELPANSNKGGEGQKRRALEISSPVRPSTSSIEEGRRVRPSTFSTGTSFNASCTSVQKGRPLSSPRTPVSSSSAGAKKDKDLHHDLHCGAATAVVGSQQRVVFPPPPIRPGTAPGVGKRGRLSPTAKKADARKNNVGDAVVPMKMKISGYGCGMQSNKFMGMESNSKQDASSPRAFLPPPSQQRSNCIMESINVDDSLKLQQSSDDFPFVRRNKIVGAPRGSAVLKHHARRPATAGTLTSKEVLHGQRILGRQACASSRMLIKEHQLSEDARGHQSFLTKIVQDHEREPQAAQKKQEASTDVLKVGQENAYSIPSSILKREERKWIRLEGKRADCAFEAVTTGRDADEHDGTKADSHEYSATKGKTTTTASSCPEKGHMTKKSESVSILAKKDENEDLQQVRDPSCAVRAGIKSDRTTSCAISRGTKKNEDIHPDDTVFTGGLEDEAHGEVHSEASEVLQHDAPLEPYLRKGRDLTEEKYRFLPIQHYGVCTTSSTMFSIEKMPRGGPPSATTTLKEYSSTREDHDNQAHIPFTKSTTAFDEHVPNPQGHERPQTACASALSSAAKRQSDNNRGGGGVRFLLNNRNNFNNRGNEQERSRGNDERPKTADHYNRGSFSTNMRTTSDDDESTINGHLFSPTSSPSFGAANSNTRNAPFAFGTGASPRSPLLNNSTTSIFSQMNSTSTTGSNPSKALLKLPVASLAETAAKDIAAGRCEFVRPWTTGWRPFAQYPEGLIESELVQRVRENDIPWILLCLQRVGKQVLWSPWGGAVARTSILEAVGQGTQGELMVKVLAFFGGKELLTKVKDFKNRSAQDHAERKGMNIKTLTEGEAAKAKIDCWNDRPQSRG
ncbi:unnamed protein product [Amoebophrya sp. A25]|nr:unnamed protein product [Amoebophrya sp. A25]|eukprot:GSA25T00025660001.1